MKNDAAASEPMGQYWNGPWEDLYKNTNVRSTLVRAHLVI